MTDDLAKLVGIGFRDPEKLVNRFARHLLKSYESEYEQRGQHFIHPSEAAAEHWCPRSSYYRLAGVSPDPVPRQLAMEMIFERGHDAHRKYQTWLREMGVLSGTWLCLLCRLRWQDTSPSVCPRCEAGADLIEYAEVPAERPEYLLAGQADGDVDGVLIEVKTIGPGTIRIDAPALVERHSYRYADSDGKIRSGVDWVALWRSIRRPFPSHLRQGMIYCFCKDRKKIIFLYEPKFLTTYPKEFEVTFRRDLIENVLDECLVVKKSLENGRPPKRPLWADIKSPICARCVYKTVCWSLLR